MPQQVPDPAVSSTLEQPVVLDPDPDTARSPARAHIADYLARSARTVSYEPADLAIGRFRGELTTEAHLAADGNGRGLAVLLSAGQAGDAPMMPAVLEAIAVPRLVGGPPRRNPDRVLAGRTLAPALIG
ncbi:hypothetical protein ACFWZ2_43005 [Streptomyces sp. NPDC059002]|uniref:hypothetical protein n=1 Tax=Streptomyces sp. NPDC059002 TaxID=3346690 RepID=UPI00369169E4